MAYLQPAAWIILPWAEERVHWLFKAGVKHVQSLHSDGIVETKAPVVVVQVHADSRRVPVVSNRDAAVLSVSVQPVLQTEAPVPCGGSEADEAFPVAALGGDSQVPHAFVLHIHLPVVLAAGILGCGEDTTESGEAGWQVWLLVTNAALLHFCVKV